MTVAVDWDALLDAPDDYALWRAQLDLSDEERAAIPEPIRAKIRDRLRSADRGLSRPTSPPKGKGGAMRQTEPRAFPWRWVGEIDVELIEPYLVKGLLWRSGHFVLVYGKSGGGKTFWVIDLVMHVALARKWRGRRVNRGLVVYIASEAGMSVFRRMPPAMNALASDGDDAGVPLAIVTRGVNLLDLGDVGELIAELKRISAAAGMPIAAVVLDTWSRSMPGGDENGSESTTLAVGAVDDIRAHTGATVIAVHHSGKDPTKGARGHSSLYAAADEVIRVEDGIASVEKVRDGPGGEEFAFELEVVDLGLDQDGDPVTTCLVRHVEAPANSEARGPVLSGVAKTALQALQEVISEGGTPMPETSTIPAGVVAVRIDAWRTRFALRYGEGGDGARESEAVRKAFARGREALLKAGAIGISTPWAWQDRTR